MRLIPYIFKELLNKKRFSLLFIINLTLGLTGFITLDGFKTSLHDTLEVKSKSILGADLGLSSRRPLKPEELNLVSDLHKDHPYKGHKSQVQKTNTVEMFSMVANDRGQSRLIQIQAIEAHFPFYGKIELEKNKFAGEKDFQNIYQNQVAWVYPEVLTQLQINIGDTIHVGEAEFKVRNIVTNDSAAGFTTNMAPRIYIGLAQLEKTHLLKMGSIAWYSILFKIPLNKKKLNQLKQEVIKRIDNPDVRVYTHENVSAQMTSLLSHLNHFLGLASLVALFLSSIGAGFLFRSYLKNKVREMAILISLGSSHTKALSFYLIQVLFLGLLSSLLAIIFAWVLVPGLGPLIQGFLPLPVQLHLNPSTPLIGILVGTLGCFSTCLPILMPLKGLKPSLLLTGNPPPQQNHIWLNLISALPGVLLFWSLSLWLSDSLKLGSLFTVTFLITGLFFLLSAWLLFKFLKVLTRTFHKDSTGNVNTLTESGLVTLPHKASHRIHNPGHRTHLSLKWALRDLTRIPFSTYSSFLAIGLGMLLLNLIPQIQNSLDTELQHPKSSKLPSLFLFDIQEEQLAPLKEILNNHHLEFSQLSPIVRARLKFVNGKELKKTTGEMMNREEERDMGLRNRGFNLSYRRELSKSERIIRGTPFSGNHSSLPEISIEKRFAKKWGLQIGDTMTFDIESVLVKGKIVNIRSVKWSSFQPNFFIQFQTGVLNAAPKTFLGTLPHISPPLRETIQNAIVEKLPNISIINVSRLVRRLKEVLIQVIWALRLMTFLCLIAGFVVIFSIANHQAKNRRWDIGLLKALGASFRDIRWQFLWQFTLIAFFASLLGSSISLLVGFLISKFIFESIWTMDPVTPIASLIFCILLTLLITDWAIRGALATKTRELLC